ncbi:hypothetical protein [Methanolacinia paynteri]|uniref:hypothetical protein n=1 Tax=Methanolacinia paynteri TaxID=230356 RepID=UPI00064E7607|nr:hypothetical protein [Methanolacinia paynteri]
MVDVETNPVPILRSLMRKLRVESVSSTEKKYMIVIFRGSKQVCGRDVKPLLLLSGRPVYSLSL